MPKTGGRGVSEQHKLDCFRYNSKNNAMKKIFTLSAFYLLPAWALCCSCLYFTSFCELITPQSAVAKVRIFNTTVYQYGLWIDVAVEEPLQGAVQHDTLTILASRGTSCDPSFEAFSIGDELVVHLGEAIADGPTDWFTFAFQNACQQDFLEIVDGQVELFADGKWRLESYQNFKKNIIAGGCAEQRDVPDKATLERLLSVYPLPASTEATIDLQIALDYELALFSANGQLLLENAVVNEARHQLDVSRLPNGVYLLRLRFEAAELVRKLVVQR